MKTSMRTMCCNMCGMCYMPEVHICMISECDVFKLRKNR